MPQFKPPLSFRELLVYCSDRDSPHWEFAWREFYKRYGMFLYNSVRKRCRNFNVPRLRRQLPEVVDDIVAEVLVTLTKSIGNYREVDNEDIFPYYLAIIFNRTSSRFIKRQFVPAMVDQDIHEIKSEIQNMPPDTRVELYEHLVCKLRASDSGRKRNIERDINIFQFYFWADLSEAMIQSHPCLLNEGERVVENVIRQMRIFLKETSDDSLTI